MSLSELLKKVAADTDNPELNMLIAHEYDKMDQTAAAISFYLKAAEYGYDIPEASLIVYTSVLKVADCLYRQHDRTFAVSNNYLQAIAFLPDRPEAYYLLARFYERTRQWQECYSWASVSENTLFMANLDPLPLDVEYQTQVGVAFVKAVSADFLGRRDEASRIFNSIVELPQLPENLRKIARDNLKVYGVSIREEVPPYNTLEPVVTAYRKFFGTMAESVVDVGSRDGDDAHYLAQQLHAPLVIAIEANPDLIPSIEKKYPYMEVYSTAISNYEGTTTFQQVTSEDKSMVGCSSIYAEKVAKEPQFQGLVREITVPVTTLKSIWDTYSTFDVVKIDVEGFTWEVLEGLGDLLGVVKVFHLETDVISTQPNAKTPEFIREFMESKGFYLTDVSHEWGWGIQDQVWVNKKLARFHQEAFNVVL